MHWRGSWLMLAQGTPLHVVSEVLGHAGIAITKDVHLYPGEMDRCANRLNEAAGMSDTADDAAKMRPDDDLDEDEDEQDQED